MRTPLGWVLSGPLPSRLSGGASMFKDNAVDDQDLAVHLRTWWDLETYSAVRSVDPRAKGDRSAQEILESTTVHDGFRYVVVGSQRGAAE